MKVSELIMLLKECELKLWYIIRDYSNNHLIEKGYLQEFSFINYSKITNKKYVKQAFLEDSFTVAIFVDKEGG